jgi:hypothetical protein
LCKACKECVLILSEVWEEIKSAHWNDWKVSWTVLQFSGDNERSEWMKERFHHNFVVFFKAIKFKEKMKWSLRSLFLLFLMSEL